MGDDVPMHLLLGSARAAALAAERLGRIDPAAVPVVHDDVAAARTLVTDAWRQRMGCASLHPPWSSGVDPHSEAFDGRLRDARPNEGRIVEWLGGH